MTTNFKKLAQRRQADINKYTQPKKTFVKKGGGVLLHTGDTTNGQPHLKGSIKMRTSKGNEVEIPIAGWWQKSSHGKHLALGIAYAKNQIDHNTQEMIDEVLKDFGK